MDAEVNTIDKKLAIELSLEEILNTTLSAYTFPNSAPACKGLTLRVVATKDQMNSMEFRLIQNVS
jgi:hypothetical protein